MDAKSLLKPVWDIASCPVCFYRLRPPTTCCINGHAVCAKCGGQLTECPTCKGRFSQDKHTTLDQLLEALPMPCKHKGCTEDTRDDPDHEKWCGFRDMRCRWGGGCGWTGPVNQLQQHVRQRHPWYTIDVYNNEYGGVRLTPSDYSVTVAVVEHGHVFWLTWKRMGQNRMLSYQILCVPIGRVCEEKLKFKVEFKSEKSYLDASTKIQFDPDCDGLNWLMFHFDALKPYTINGWVRPKFYILKE